MYGVSLKYEAAVAQLVEHHVANVNVTSSSLVSRSNFQIVCSLNYAGIN